ncbi:putative quinol monooxygenase [Microbacterium sp. 22303]|uniref:putative quinol monooxygenase n=1 Tax=Microbacterium sp. 22303 TaxID=3453905 RepID=UPI003F857031
MDEIGFAVNARYRVQSDHLEDVLELLNTFASLSRLEPGSIDYQYFQNPQDPQDLLILEQYPSEAEFQAHLDSEHFRSIARDQIIPRLESRVVMRYVPHAD